MTLLQAFLLIYCTVMMLLWFRYWKLHADRFSQSGYVPPATSVFGKFWFGVASRFLVFMTVGRVQVIRRAALPAGDNSVIFVSNHQFPSDFALLRLGAGRHFRMLTSSDELKGFFGVIAAFLGVISVAFRSKTDGRDAEEACSLTVSGFRGSLGIFAEGSLLPGSRLRKKEWRPGVVRIARKAAELQRLHRRDTGPVLIVPMALHYRHDAMFADWTHTFLSRTRSMWLGMRNPKSWDPLFKEDLTKLGDAERAEVERLRETKLKAYRRSHVTNYGAVVVVGEPIDVRLLPEDPLAAVEVIRGKVADLLLQAQRY